MMALFDYETILRQYIRSEAAEGRAEGIAEGERKGRAEGMRNSVKVMYSNGVKADFISSVLNIPLNEVNEIPALN